MRDISQFKNTRNITITLELPQALKLKIQLQNLNIPFKSMNVGNQTFFDMNIKETLINIISEIIREI